MAQHGDMRIGLLFVLREIPAEHGMDAEYPEEIRRDDRRGKLLRVAHAG